MKLSCFKKTLKINECKKDSSVSFENTRAWCFRSNKHLSAIFAILTFFLMISFIGYCNFSKLCVINDHKSNQDTSACVFANSVTVKCEHVTKGYLIKEMNKAITAVKPKSCIDVIIKNYNFEGTALNEGWLGDFEFCIKTLVLNKINILELGQRAFYGKPFEKLSKLIFTNTNITILRNNSFYGARISTLHFHNDCFNNVLIIEEDALIGISKTLQFLKIKGFSKAEKNLLNMMRKSDGIFTKLQSIEINCNNLKLINLRNGSLNTAVSLKPFPPNNNHLEKNEGNTLLNILDDCIYVDFNHNNLKTNLDEVLHYFNSSFKIIIIDNNPWYCNCSLDWLKKLYIESANLNKMPFHQIYFCNNLKQEVEQLPVENYCRLMPKKYIADLCAGGTILIRAKKINFSINEEDGAKVVFTIKTERSTDGYHLVWFDVKRKVEICAEMENKTIILENLKRGHTYVICLFEENDEGISPLDCSSIKISLADDDLTWIFQKHKYWFIGINLVILLAAVMLSALLMFYYIRKHPKILKDNKRLVIMGNKAVKAILLPENDTKLQGSQSFTSNSQGYLEPKSLQIILNNSLIRSTSISNDSIHSESVSYASAHYGSSAIDIETRSNLSVF